MALTTIPVELLTLDDGVTITVDDNSNALTITSTDADASVGPGLDLYRNSSSPADNDVLGTIFFHGEDGAGNKTEYARIEAGTDDVSNGAEAGSLTVFTNNADTLTNNRFEINSLGLVINEVGGNFDTRIESNNNANMLVIDGGDDMVFIGKNAKTSFDAYGTAIMMQLEAAGTTPYAGFGMVQNSNDADSAVLIFGKSRGTSVASTTIVQDDDVCGRIEFQGMDGGDLETCARIMGSVDGTPGTDDMPGRLTFATTADGANTPTERMRIDSNGQTTLTGQKENSSGDAYNYNLILAPDTSLSIAAGKGTGILFQSEDSGSSARDAANINSFRTASSASNTSNGLRFSVRPNGAEMIETFRLKEDEAVFNENSGDIDFRVESDAFVNMLTVNAGLDSVGIGHSGGTARLTCAQTSASNITGYFFNSASTIANSSSSILYLQTTGDSAIQDGYKIVTFADSDTVIGTISSAASSTNVAYNTSSDERLKENIVDMESQLDKVLAAKPRQFDWKKNGVTSQGFIAQELQEVFPEAVTVGGEDPTESPWSVDYGRVTPFLMKAIQEQQAQIEELKTEIAALKGE